MANRTSIAEFGTRTVELSCLPGKTVKGTSLPAPPVVGQARQVRAQAVRFPAFTVRGRR